jgi:hypothetical protein
MMSYSRFLLVLFVAVSIFTVSGCGSGGSGTSSPPASVYTPTPATVTNNSYSLSADTFGLKNANFLAATNENGVFTLRVAIAASLTDPNFTDVYRINILQPTQISAPGTYSIGGNGGSTIPPCEILFFNGEKSSQLDTISGAITFSSYGANTGDLVAGTFAVQIEDAGSIAVPKPVYTINGNFSFVVNMPGAI